MRKDAIKRLILNHNRRLQKLREQQALEGIRTDPRILIEIEDIETKLEALQAELEALSDQTKPSPRPKNQATPPEIEPPYGTMNPASEFYIERDADEEFWGYLSTSRAATLFVQASRQMGKSSLMRRIIYRASKELGRPSVFVDFQELPKQYFSASDERNFLIELCLIIGRALDIPEAIDRHWMGLHSNIRKCGLYLSEYIIPRVNQPFVLAIDEVDRMVASPFRDNFFGMLRVWHNNRAYDENFKKVSLFLSSSMDSSLLIENDDQSPFNVADHISLRDFTPAQVEELNRRHGSPLDQSQVQELMTLVNGHPFLTRLALYQVATGRISAAELFAQATQAVGPFGDQLHYCLGVVLREPDLRQALINVCRNQPVRPGPVYYRLERLGLIQRRGSQVLFRNRLWERYFKKQLLSSGN